MGMYDIGCANTAALNSYLAQLDKADRYEHAIATRTNEILEDGGQYSATTALNIAEAVAESMYGKHAEALTNALLRCMGDKIIDKDALSLSMVMAGAVKSYWYEAAKRQAEDEISKATCTACYDTGCPRCDPQDEWRQ